MAHADSPGPAGLSGSPALVEQLTGREIEVLRLMATGSPIRKIASQLYLSPNTLKAHSQNIYAKLDVHNRIEAVNRARELGLI
jgi:LuxR family maltose regulon positive regulatory protein